MKPFPIEEISVIPPDKSFMQYYLQELSVLEDDCAEFANAYPQVAGNLGMDGAGMADPHVRQLIESVAFIAARLKRQIDSVPGELALGLLQATAPHLTAPVPSMSVARFFPLTDQLNQASRAKGSIRLRATANGEESLFTGCMDDVSLWPLELECPQSDDPSLKGLSGAQSDDGGFVMKITHPGKRLAQGAPGELTFFISGALNRALAAVDSLTVGLISVRMVALDGSWSVPLPRQCTEVLGFEPGHRLMPEPWRDRLAGSLALEFLNFPRRFCFVKVSGLHCPQPAGGFLLVFTVKRSSLSALEAVRGHVLLNCVPIINVYERPPIAVRLAGHRDEYTLPRGDAGRGNWDVFAIRRVQLVEREKRHEVAAFHAGISNTPSATGQVFWDGVRRERIGENLGHASLVLRLIGLDPLRKRNGDAEMAMVDALCTNCHAPENLPSLHPLSLQGWDCPYQARLELVPTAYVNPVLPTDTTIAAMLHTLQARDGRVGNMTQAVRNYLAVHDRTRSAHAAAAVSALDEIRHEVVAMPWSDAPLGTMLGMGYRYTLAFRKDSDLLGSRHLLAQLLMRVVKQMHSAPFPMEVVAEDGHGGVFHVD